MRQPAVYLIGAGPGDPRLITVLGLECLRNADVVVYDHLVSKRLLQHARRDAELIDVGTGAPRSMAQEAISYLIADKAREGKLVARLKWGDPFVFARGGEEALYLSEQHVPFEIVPGVPAGTGVPAYAGVPVGYPGGGDTITLVRGFEDDTRAPDDMDWASLAHLDGTLVCYAGPYQLSKILDAMVSQGWPDDADALVVYNGTLSSQETIHAPLGELKARLPESYRRTPAMLIVGRVIGFREHLRWFDARPLFGRRVIVTRPRAQAAEMCDRLSAFGAEPIEVPMIRIEPTDDPGPLLGAATDPRRFDWIVFGSANAVDAFMAAFFEAGARDVRALTGPRLCAVGTGTAEALRTYGVTADLVPREFRSEAVVAAMADKQPLDGARVLLPRADIGREVIADQLRAAGADVTEVVAYRTVLNERLRDEDPDIYKMLLEGRVDVVTFASPSAVRNFLKIYGEDQVADLLRQTAVAAIGPVTADAATQLGIPVTIQPSTYTVPALVDAIAAHFSATKTTTKV